MKRISTSLTLALLTGALMFIYSCSKKDTVYGPAPEAQQQSQSVEDKIRIIARNLPNFTATDQAANPNLNWLQDGWSFSNPTSGGFNYSSPSGATYSQSTNTFIVATSAFGGNSGGTIVAGSTTLDMNYTFCFTANDSLFGMNSFNTGAPTFGVSAVIGVSGDFSQLNNSSADFNDVFKGLAFYVVYDDQASGSYDVVDWTDPSLNLSSLDDLDKMAFAFLMDFKNGKFYLSSGGKITVDGGQMTFSGDYLEVSGFLDDNGDFDLNSSNITYTKVSGFGTLGCS